MFQLFVKVMSSDSGPLTIYYLKWPSHNLKFSSFLMAIPVMAYLLLVVWNCLSKFLGYCSDQMMDIYIFRFFRLFGLLSVRGRFPLRFHDSKSHMCQPVGVSCGEYSTYTLVWRALASSV